MVCNHPKIAGLHSYLEASKTGMDLLLTVEVVCEGVPSPLYIRKLDQATEKKYGSKIESLDYRYTGKSILSHGKWDFEKMRMKIGVGRLSENSDRHRMKKR